VSAAQEVIFRPFRLDVENEQLWRGSQLVSLRPKTFAVLRCLVERAGRLVSKEELLDTVWPGTTVSDVVPIVCVRELRKALGDDAEAPRFIETLARRGYRFIAPLTTTQPVISCQLSIVSRKGVRSPSLPTQSSVLCPQSSVLVGRNSELVKLHQLLDRALGGERQFVFISGESGIGKTALVDAFLGGIGNWELGSGPPLNQIPNPKSQIPNPRLWIGRGQCIEQHGAGEAYLPLLDVTGRLCREPSGQEIIDILRQHAPTWLMQFPSLLSTTDVEALQRRTLGTTRERMLREMAEAMEVATATRPFVLILEDLHWCDASTLDFLSFLAHRPEPARLFVIGTYRPAELTPGAPPLATLTQELLQHQQATEIAVPLLTQAEVAAYLSMRLAPELRDGLRLGVNVIASEAKQSLFSQEIASSPAAPRNDSPSLTSRYCPDLRNDLPVETWACRLHQRTDGNPLFLTNVVDYLLSQRNGNGAEHPRPSIEQLLDVVPHSLQHMIEKQIDRLSLEDQQLLEVASVVGIEFSAAAVAVGLERDVVTIEERCRELARREHFLRTQGVEEWPDRTIATQYGFIHSLYQQVLYQRVTEAQKVRLHLRIGTRLEAGYRACAKDNATALAMHFTLGRDYVRAVRYAQQAAENAVWRCAFQEANAHFTKGIELLHHWPDSPERTQQEILLHLTVLGPLIAVKGEASSDVELVYARIIQLHQRLGSTELPFMVLLGLWMVRLVRGELTAAEELAQHIARQAEKEGEVVVRLWASLINGICVFYRGDFTLAHVRFGEAVALYDAQQHPQYLIDPKMLALSFDALSLWMLGRLRLAQQRSEEAVAWGQGLSHPYNNVATLLFAAWLNVHRRDGESAGEQIDMLLPVAQARGFIQYAAFGKCLRGSVLLEQRQPDAGLGLMHEGLAELQAAKVRLGMSAWQGLLAPALENVGRLEEALAVTTKAESAMHDNGERFFAAELCRIRGELLLRQTRGQESGARGQNRGIVVSNQYSVVSSPPLPTQSSVLSPQSLASPNSESQIPDPASDAEACFLKAIDIARQQQAKSLELRAVMSLVRFRKQQVIALLPCAVNGATRNTQHDTHALLAKAHDMLSELCEWFADECETADLREARGILGKSSQ
jgi:DNA-binding winged helix-turn-helix (wHTH) protein/predicted ATPase